MLESLKAEFIQLTKKQLSALKIWWMSFPINARQGLTVAVVAVCIPVLVSFTGCHRETNATEQVPVEALARQAAAEERARETSAIEQVLGLDSTTGTGVTTAAERVHRMRAIDLNGCPNDFKAAYLAHIHAWESMVLAERDVNAFKANNSSGGVMLESFIRGLLGDPLGKPQEMTAAQNELGREYKAARGQIKMTFDHVEEFAVAHGAKLGTTPAPPTGHSFNANGFCVRCGWERDFVTRTQRPCVP